MQFEEKEFAQKLRDYAELIAVHGLNVQPNQLVHLSGEVAHRELLLLLSEQCYRRGASLVQTEILDSRFSRQRIDLSGDEYLQFLPDYIPAKYNYFVEHEVASAKIVGPEYPLIMKGANPKKTNTVRKAAYESRKRFYEEGIDKSRVHWTVVAASTEGWGARIYPERSPKDAMKALWEDLFTFCRIGNGDHLEQWKRHDDELQNRARHLSSLGIEELHFQSEGTDLRVGLSSRAKFQGGRSRSTRGVLFEPNLPTEECFTTPNWRACYGKVRATRPFYVNGELIQDLQMTLQDGEITSFSASQGEDVFREYIQSDEGANRLGEVALVSVSSPIFQSGRVYEEILLDENAACHIAIGSAYRFCVNLPEDSTDDQFQELGCNSSSVHTDIMISDETTRVSARCSNGEEISIIRDGDWDFE
ncbi:MAG: aminopeptidase [Bdellovibrionales bacterium]|nr:aminopeptidase [Bdellovibrionales bacterium]